MQIGLVLALLSAIGFAVSQVFLRRGAFRAGESITAVVIATLVGTVFFLVVILINGDWSRLMSSSWQGFVALGAAGIIHFIVGRLLITRSIRLIGANRAAPLVRTFSFYSVVFGILILDEPVTALLIVGVLLLGGGVLLLVSGVLSLLAGSRARRRESQGH